MPTKIINILKDDKFEDILNIFTNTPAQEVIFVLPKSHKAFSTPDHFARLAEASGEHNKNVLILTSNPELNKLALEHGFGILTSDKKEFKPKKEVKVAVVDNNLSESELESGPELESEPEPELEPEPDQPEEVDDEVVDEEDLEESEKSEDSMGAEVNDDESREETIGFESEEESLPEVELAAVRKPTKMMSDIIGPEDQETKINISKKSERPLSINIKKEEPEKRPIEDIESVWQARPSDDKKIFQKSNRAVSAPKLPKEPWKLKFTFPNMKRKAITYFGAGVIILFAVVIYVSTGSANIVVKPRAYPLDLNIKAIASDQFTDVDLKLKKVPGQLFTINKKIEQTFQSSGEREVAQKARGVVTVYNEYGTTPQVLIATTRFESSQGFIFRTLKTVSVPGTTVSNGKITPGSIEVEVIADKAGEAYNIEPGRFSIPAFKEKGDSDRYQKFYAVSKESMKGGIVGKAKVVTDQDYISAKEVVSQRLISEAEQDLKNQASSLRLLSLSGTHLQDPTSTAKPDEAAESFTLSQTATLETVGFKDEDLHELISQYVGSINDLVIVPEKLELEFKDIKFNQELKVLEFTVFVKGSAYSKIDKDKLISDLIGKKEKEIMAYIQSTEAISSARVVLSPFWVRKVPANLSKIKFELQYE